MLGLAKRSIVISQEEAKEYVQLKIERLSEEIDVQVAKLNCLQDELEDEVAKLAMLCNPPE